MAAIVTLRLIVPMAFLAQVIQGAVAVVRLVVELMIQHNFMAVRVGLAL